jgi:pyruvate dehydrogenase E1 component alpha subunit
MWKQKDPIARFGSHLTQAGILTEQGTQELRKAAFQVIEEAVAFAESSPEPRVDEITEGVYA